MMKIELKNVTKKYGDTVIYSNVNYEFNNHALTCLLGPSGSGKSTLLNLLAGFDSDFTGEIRVGTMNIKDLSPNELCTYRFNEIGFVFQNYNLLDGYTALENVLLSVYSTANTETEEYVQKAKKLLTDLGLEKQIDQNVQILSGGQKQRVAIARALIHDPQIILADEPTGALDYESAETIMNILKEISKTKTVIIITHDEKLTEFADEIIEIEDEQIIVKKSGEARKAVNEAYKNDSLPLKSKDFFRLGFKNFKIHFVKYLIAAILIAFGSASFFSAFSSKRIVNHAIDEFKEKNFYFNKGMVLKYDQGKEVNKDLTGIYEKLTSMKQIRNVYYQYNLKNITLNMNDKTIKNEFKIPTVTPTILLLYGNMPRNDKEEIVISPSLAAKFEKQIQKAVGKKMVVSYIGKNGENKEIQLTVSGISDTKYDDFILSSSVEKDMYRHSNVDEAVSISFDIKGFNEIPKVQNLLSKKQIAVYTNYKQVENFNKTFTNLIKLFTFISYFILIIGVFISTIMLYKISVERYKEIGLLSALGFNRRNIKSIFLKESFLFSGVSTGVSIVLVNALDMFYKNRFDYGLELNGTSYSLLIAINMFLCIGITFIMNQKLVRTETIIALRR
ncbi:macrolide ABC transporter ATP-binding protein/permease [Bacillus pseudomycoides]|nr:macrolide ABC transporter ATP-binding protein/permease [Bacillus pseudomycoides]